MTTIYMHVWSFFFFFFRKKCMEFYFSKKCAFIGPHKKYVLTS
jgi:hypothetical protein